MAQVHSGSKLEVVPEAGVLPYDWHSIGDVLGSIAGFQQSLAGRCSFVVRQGFDPAGAVTTGRVIEGAGDAGISLRYQSLALSVTAGGLSFKSGLDDPLPASASAAASGLPSLKATLVKTLKGGDRFLGVSYDLKQRRPQLSAAWVGDTFTERAALLVTADPLARAVNVSASVSLPGPEWRVEVLDRDNDDMVEEPLDDGARHRLYVQHEARQGHLLHRTRVGACIDVGRAVNYLADYFDYNLEEYIPPFLWRLPLAQQVYNVFVPPEDEEQMRHHIHGWSLDIGQDFENPAPALVLSKSLRHATISASYDISSREAGLHYSRAGVKLGAKIAKAGGASWGKPSLHLYLEPLSLL